MDSIQTLLDWADCENDASPLIACELSGYAAGAAMRELIANWRDAMACGQQLRDLAVDIDDVMRELKNYQRAVMEMVDGRSAA